MFIVVYVPVFGNCEIRHGHLMMGTRYERARLSLNNAACVYGGMRLSIAKGYRRVNGDPGCVYPA